MESDVHGLETMILQRVRSHFCPGTIKKNQNMWSKTEYVMFCWKSLSGEIRFEEILRNKFYHGPTKSYNGQVYDNLYLHIFCNGELIE